MRRTPFVRISKSKAADHALITTAHIHPATLLRANLGERINSEKFEDRRYVLETLGTCVTVTTNAKLLVDFAIPKEISAQAIALSVPLNACPRYSVFPLNPLLAIWLVGKSASFT
jgi:hypothetical protein